MKEILVFLIVSGIDYLLIEFPLRRSSVFKMENIKGTLAGYSVVAFLNSFFCLITGSVRVTLAALTVFYFIFGIVNYFIYRFHGAPFTIGELKNFRTAMAVVKSYRFTVPVGLTIVMVLLLSSAILFLRFNMYGSFSRYTALAGLIVFGSMIFFSFFAPKSLLEKRIVTSDWGPVLERYGYIPAFVKQTMCEISGPVEKPESYSRDETVNGFREFHTERSGAGNRPDIIFILNETFFDLESVIDLEPDDIVLKNYYGVKGAIRGRTVAPKIGGGTNASEYESLTTNSLHLMPYVMTPFNVVNLSGANTVLTYLKGMGYKTFATHPGETFSYRRNTAYPAMGFDGITFGKDYKDPEYYGKRTEYITDSSMYDNLISWYEKESRGDEPVFYYGLTIQNHGDWNVNSDSQALVHAGKDFGRYTGIFNEFLSCIRLSDKAFLKLTEYFKTVDRDVVVVMTGDHSPSFVKDKDFRDMGGRDDPLSLSSTPYIIWSNRELNRPENADVISMPLLLPTAFEASGMRLSPYFEFLSRLREDVPVFSWRDDHDLLEPQRVLLNRYYSFEFMNYTEPEATREFWI